MLEEIFQTKMNASLLEDGSGKLGVLKGIYQAISITQSIIFCERKVDCDNIAWEMNNTGYAVSVLHSGLSPLERDEVMSEFVEQRSKVLITTNVLARGVNVPAVKVVINFDLPIIHPENRGDRRLPDPSTYLHRIGRTGRFGRQGIAINFYDSGNREECEILEEIENFHMEKNSCPQFIHEWNPNNLDELSEKLKELGERETNVSNLQTGVDGLVIADASAPKKAFASHLNSGVKFSDPILEIPPAILEGVANMKKEFTSVVQFESIPLILSGKNVVAQAYTGSGKTIAFAVGLLACIDGNETYPQSLCIAPTREVCVQIAEDNRSNVRVHEAHNQHICCCRRCLPRVCWFAHYASSRWYSCRYQELDSKEIH